MRNRLLAGLFALTVALLVIAACRATPKSPALIPAAYRAWQTPTNLHLNYPIPGHEDHYRKIYLNAIGATVQPVSQNGRTVYAYPVGTIIVKEMYAGHDEPQPNEQPVHLTSMIKAPADTRALSGWLWVVTDVKMQQETVIDDQFCVECHANANEPHPYGDRNPAAAHRDFVFFPPQSWPSSEFTPAPALNGIRYQPAGAY